MHTRLAQWRDFVNRHRPAVLGIAYGSGALLLFLLIVGVVGRAARSTAEENEARIERRLEAARARRAAPPTRVETRRKLPAERRPATAAGRREYEVQVRDDDLSAVEAEPLPPVDTPPPEVEADPLPEIPQEGDELHDPEG